MNNNKTSICYQVDHLTELEYSHDVLENSFILTIQPIERKFQKIQDYQLKIFPQTPVSHYQDNYGNNKHCFNILTRHNEIKIHSSFKAVVSQSLPSDTDFSKVKWEDLKDLDMWDHLKDSYFAKSSKELEDFLHKNQLAKKDTPFSSLQTLNSKLYDIFEYSPNSTQAHSFIEEILKTKKGVCQDYTHVMIAISRLWGIPSRYVSGYLYQEKEGDLSSLVDQSHAWCECYLPSVGWIGFDPTNNMLAGKEHIITALGRDYKDVPPHDGCFKGEGVTKSMNVKVYVKKI